jgi:hypothetical protein
MARSVSITRLGLVHLLIAGLITGILTMGGNVLLYG